ncbi:YgfZ/GcvT domain-containing protein [Pontivivens nitratireducens]|uniref:CAF17-like 4Fe-4S cluster assembly/insertion protein YgfZ n=1 Tax=Pontivivens nitratireducens TaxID=2758038 RepID=UPI00201C49B8|nr:folate-binding protein [Pontibrevibacter nitratireducens]
MTDALHDRRILRLSGADTRDFLQGLISNDIAKADDGLIYAALLNPQGKYLADFFVLRDGEDYLLDVAGDLSRGLMQRLGMYRLRADVQIEDTDISVAALAEAVDGAYPDPRDAGMGWRLYGGDTPGMDRSEYDARRVAHLVPESGVELIPNDSYLLEVGFERLSGVDFRKGCYVGQEVTARMKHKTELRKGLARVAVEGPVPEVGTPINADTRQAGKLFTVAAGQGIAYLRYDRAEGEMQAGQATVRRL